MFGRRAASSLGLAPPTITATHLPPGHPEDVPRDNLGWPVVEPGAMTLAQLMREADKWVDRSGDVEGPGPTQVAEFQKYTDELVRRSFLDRIDISTWLKYGLAPTMEYRARNPDFPDQKRWLPCWPANRVR